MIEKIYLSLNDEFEPVIISFIEEQEDFVFDQIPNGLTRMEMLDLMSEVKRITNWDD